MTLYKYGEVLKEIHLQQRISYVVMLLLLSMSAWIVGDMIWQPWKGAEITAWRPSGVANTAADSDSPLDLSLLQNSHLFGTYQANAPVVQPKVQDAPKSRLNLVVVGVVTSTVPQKSLAVIANRGRQVTYGINEVIQGTSAKLIQVQADRIIVDNSGRHETLMLEGLKYTKAQATKPRETSRNRNQASPETLNRIREEIRQDPRQIFQYVRMSQVQQEGGVIGYRLSPGRDRALFEAVGLKSGDIAVSLNGLSLSDPAAMTQIFRNLSQLTELSLTVERDGQPYQVYIEL